MKIVEPSVTLVHYTPNPERVIERMGRICYQSDHKVAVCKRCNGTKKLPPVIENDPCVEPCGYCNGTGTDIESAIAFVRKVRDNGHTSVLEHASAGFMIITDRGVTHEIVRHRIGCSYSQESTRYCNYSNDRHGHEILIIQPPDLCPERESVWFDACCAAEASYLTLSQSGLPPQIARSVLPTCLKSEIGMTADFTAWRHFLRLRTSPKAHPQMQQIAEMIRAELLKISKVCFEDIP